MMMKLPFVLALSVFAGCLFATGNGQQVAGSFDPTVPSSFETTDEIVDFAELTVTQAINFAGGNYGNTDLMNDVIEQLNVIESDLIAKCQEVSGATDEEVSECEQEVNTIVSGAIEKLTTMRDIDIETDIIILFGQYWRPNACLGGQSFGAPAYGNDQCFDVQKNYTIHGIWPSSTNVRAFPNPTNCSDADDLQPEDVGDLEPDLNERWVSYYPIWNNFQFWQWEWFKHGSCWDRTKQEFLQQAIEWHDLYDIPSILQEEGIPLGVLVNTTEMLDKLTNRMWGARLGLLCIGEGEFVDQFFACFDWSGKNPVDCPPASQCNDEVLFRVYQEEDIPTDTSSAYEGSKAMAVTTSFLFALMVLLSGM